MWDLSCPDWEARLLSGRSLIPDLPLNDAEADMALRMFDELRLPDVPDTPTMADACGQWYRDIVRAAFGSWNPAEKRRYIRDIFAMVPKGQSKTTYSAGLMLVGMMMNRRPRSEALFVAPTQAIADNAFDKAAGMIALSPDLQRRFKVQDYNKTIKDLVNNSHLRVKTFDVSVLTGTIPFLVMVDELHLLGKNAHTAKVLRQIRGGLEKTPEGLLIFTTTQSDEQPAGAFKAELKQARRIRDGKYRGMAIKPMLPILYEFPPEIAQDPEQWRDPDNWPLVMPNMGRSVHLDSLVADWNTEKEKGDAEVKIWASQHLNIEIGVGIMDDAWLGADFWEACADPDLTLDSLIERSEVAVMGVDGGGLDDLLGVVVIGRERGSRERGQGRWMAWCHAFAHRKVLEVRKDIASRLEDFEREGDLTFVEIGEDVQEIAKIGLRLKDAELLPAKYAVGFDPNNISAIIAALKAVGLTEDMLRRVLQGPALTPAINELPRMLCAGQLSHDGSDLMNWCVGNAKVEDRGNGRMVTKQISGHAKIDPFIALLNAGLLASWDPQPAKTSSVYDGRGIRRIA